MSRSTLLAIVALMVANPASADGLLGAKWTSSGFLGFAMVERGSSSSKGLLLADADVAYSFGQFSAEFSMTSIHGQSYFGSDIHVMGGLGYNFGNGSIVYAGAPRPGFDRFGRFGVGATSRYLGLFVAVTDKSAYSNISVRGPKREGYGFRYDSAEDAALAFSVSVLRDPDFEGTAAGGSGQYKVGPTTLSGGLEYTSEPGGDAVQAKFIAETRYQFWGFGGGISHYERDGALQQTYGELSAVYSPNDHIDLTAYAARIDDNLGSGGLDTYGFGARYNFGLGSDIGASLSRFDDDKVLEISASVHF